MWPFINSFLDQIAAVQGYSRDSLGLIVTLQADGPTVSPLGGAAPNVRKKVEVFTEAHVNSMPSPWYDSLQSNHIDMQVVQKQSSGVVTIPRSLYAFQHHVLPGNCRICVQRWVRVTDTTPWSQALLDAGLKFRAQYAKHAAQTQSLFVSSGRSFNGAEQYDKFQKLYVNPSHSMYVLDLNKFLGAA